MNKQNKFFGSERGQALIIIVFALIGLIGLTGLTVDGGLAYSDRRNAQNAVDTAALAAARAKIRGEVVNTTIYSLAAANGYDNNGESNTVTITIKNSPNGVCPSTGQDIRVDIVSILKTTFSTVVGVDHVTNHVWAESRACDVAGGVPMYNGTSVYATKLGTCGNGLKDKSLFVQGSANLQVWGGGLGSASLDGNCIAFKGGETQLKKAESGTSCANIITSAPASEASDADFSHATGQDGCGLHLFGQSFDPPPADLGITCAGNAVKSGSSMSPGNYVGDFPPAGVTTLNPGVYCVTGSFTLNGGQNLNGSGVTIVLKTGNLHWNGGAEVNLSPPTGNVPTKGLLIYLPPSNTSDVDVNGSSNAKITGTILAQNSDCFFAGSGQLQKQKLQFICSTWGMDGNGQAELMYDASVLYSPPIMPTITLLR